MNIKYPTKLIQILILINLISCDESNIERNKYDNTITQENSFTATINQIDLSKYSWNITLMNQENDLLLNEMFIMDNSIEENDLDIEYGTYTIDVSVTTNFFEYYASNDRCSENSRTIHIKKGKKKYRISLCTNNGVEIGTVELKIIKDEEPEEKTNLLYSYQLKDVCKNQSPSFTWRFSELYNDIVGIYNRPHRKVRIDEATFYNIGGYLKSEGGIVNILCNRNKHTIIVPNYLKFSRPKRISVYSLIIDSSSFKRSRTVKTLTQQNRYHSDGFSLFCYDYKIDTKIEGMKRNSNTWEKTEIIREYSEPDFETNSTNYKSSFNTNPEFVKYRIKTYFYNSNPKWALCNLGIGKIGYEIWGD